MTGARLNWQGIAFLLLLLLAWEATARLGRVRSDFFPPISTIAVTFWSLIVSLELVREYGLTLWRALAGFAVASVTGIGVGLLMGFYRPVHALLEPLIEMLRPIPPVALIAVAILLLGIDDAMAIFVIAWSCFFPIWLNTLEGVLSVDRGLLDTARSFRMSHRSTMLKIMLPAAMPFILTGMRISLAFALIVTVVAEMIASEAGVGRYIIDAEAGFRVTQMYAAVISLALVGYALNGLFVLAERRLLRWHVSAPQGA